jgi:hypothetical protein
MPDGSAQEKLFTYAVLAIFVAALVTAVGFFWWKSCKTTPSIVDGFSYSKNLIEKINGPTARAPPTAEQAFTNQIQNMMKSQAEGFYAGPAVGAGAPDCMNTSKDAAELYAMLNKRPISTEEGPDDLRELGVILSKISCFKRDLMGTAGVVEATRYQPFSTSHDLEPVAETTARCFARTIPQRDLSLSLDKWGSRGTFLLKRLCTSEKLSEAEEEDALRLFGDAMADITEIALGKCCNSDVGIIAGQPQPRMVGGYETPAISSLRQYTGYY